jgi:hypothetical protein
VKRKWLEFVARPRFLPLYGDDEDFLQAPIDGNNNGLSVSKWSETVKNLIAAKNEREFELRAAESAVVDGVSLVELGSWGSCALMGCYIGGA